MIQPKPSVLGRRLRTTTVITFDRSLYLAGVAKCTRSNTHTVMTMN